MHGPPAWSLGLNLLLVSATLCPSLIAPSTGASAVLRYWHLSKSLDNLYALCQTVIEYGERLQGLNLNPAAFRGLRNVAAWKEEMETLHAAVREWKERAPNMTMKFAAATMVWQRWQRPDGLIGSLIEKTLSEDGGDFSALRKTIKELQDPVIFVNLVTRCDRRELGRRRGEDIHAGALAQLKDRAAEALELVRRWVELMEAPPAASDYLVKQLDELRLNLAKLKPAIARELKEISDASGDGWSLVSAGAKCVSGTLRTLEQLFEPSHPIREPEPDPSGLLNSCLLVAPKIDLDDSLRSSQQPAALLASLVPLAGQLSDWTGAFNKRLARGDCAAAKQIIELLEMAASPEVQDLSDRYRTELEHHREILRGALKASRGELEMALAYGYVNEQERARLDAILVELERTVDKVVRFEPAQARVDHVLASVRSSRDKALSVVRATYDELAPSLSPEMLDRIGRVVQQGDVLTANEYLARIKAGEPLNEPDRERDVFAKFFPAKVVSTGEFLEAPGGGLGSVVSLIKRGQPIADLTTNGLTEAQKRSAIDMLEAWQALKRAQRVDDGSLRRVLAGIGFSVTKVSQVSGTTEKSEWQIETDTISDRSVCQLPQYGSQATGRYRVICVFRAPPVDDLVRLTGETPGAQAVIVFYFGQLAERQRKELAQVGREKRRTLVVLDEILLLFLATEAASRVAAFFHCALPFAFSEPYVTTSGLVPPEMFFGRADELNAVREASGRCFIYGGRQLGKTALLREAERGFHAPREHRFARWVDLKAEGIGLSREPQEIWTVIHKELRRLGVLGNDAADLNLARRGSIDAMIDDAKRWLDANRSRRLLMLLDEADRFLEQDSRLEYPETSRLKNLMDTTNRRFKVVFAGLHNVLRTTEQANHPLAHLGDPIEIGPLLKSGEWWHARELIRQPLAAAGYNLEPDDLIVRILAQTNYYPSLIQLYCAQLLRQLHHVHGHRIDYKNGPRYAITEAMVDDAYRAKELRDAIRSRFHLTLQLDPRYEVATYVIAYAIDQKRMSFEGGMTVQAIHEAAMQWWPEGFRGTSDHEFRILLDEMVSLGVLRPVDEHGYNLRNPNVLLLMGTSEDIEAALLKERELPQDFEPNFFRAQLPREPHSLRRSPLTFGQEHTLLRKENGVTILAGSRAAGLDDIDVFLNERVSPDYLRYASPPMSLVDFLRRLDLLEKRKEGGTTLLVVPKDVEWDVGWVRLAVGRVERLRAPDRHVRVLFIAGPDLLRQNLAELRPLIDGMAVEVMSLRPWSDKFLRQWLEDIGITGADSERRKRIDNATGLWPSLLFRCAASLGGRTDVETFLRGATHLVDQVDERRATLVDLGLGSGTEQTTLRVLAELGELAEAEVSEYRDFFEVDPDVVLRHLAWAELLHLAERVGARAWRVVPIVARLLMLPQTNET